MVDVATVASIVAQAKLAAAKFDGPIKVASAIEQSSPELAQSTSAMANMRTEILRAAEQQMPASPAFDAALAVLKTATDNLDAIAKVMTNATSIVTKVDSLLRYGTKTVSALKALQGAGDDYAYRLAAGKMCTNRRTPHPQAFPYPPRCPICGLPVR